MFDTAKCKSKHWRLLDGFILVAELVPEAEVKAKYMTPQKEKCTIYLQWFNEADGSNRMADVWVSKDCSKDMKKHFKNHKVPTSIIKAEPEDSRQHQIPLSAEDMKLLKQYKK